MKKICKRCNTEQNVGEKRNFCYWCSSRVGLCEICKKSRRFDSKLQICGACQDNLRARKVLLNLEKNWTAASPYNHHLFVLYITHLRRYSLRFFHANQAVVFRELLTKTPIPTIKSWLDIYQIIKMHPITRPYKKKEGCAFTRIGTMLEELGILMHKGEEKGRQNENLFLALSISSQSVIKSFTQTLTRSGRAPRTVQQYLYRLSKVEKWMKDNIAKDVNLMTANQSNIESYLDSILLLYASKEDYSRNKLVYEIFSSLSCFYRYCLRERKILFNPCAKIQVTMPQRRLQICKSEQIIKLQSYIKNPKSNPEQAMLLALVLFYGLTTEDLKGAQLADPFTAINIKLILRRKPRTHGKRYYHREQTISCSAQPDWFLNLQTNFLKSWKAHYIQMNGDTPRYFLILNLKRISNKMISCETIRRKMLEATLTATGVAIPISVLRQTCGFLHTKYQDATMLATLGWSPELGRNFIWGNKTYYTPKDSNS